METKSYHTLDPKLKETYDRIMGTPATAKATVTDQKPAVAKPVAPAEKKTIANPHYVASNAQHAAEAEKTPSRTGHLSHMAYSSSDAKPEHTAKHDGQHKTDSLLFPIVMGAGGVIFFVFYAIFWMSFFGM